MAFSYVRQLPPLWKVILIFLHSFSAVSDRLHDPRLLQFFSQHEGQIQRIITLCERRSTMLPSTLLTEYWPSAIYVWQSGPLHNHEIIWHVFMKLDIKHHQLISRENIIYLFIFCKVDWLVVLGLTAFWDSISIYIGSSPREREK